MTIAKWEAEALWISTHSIRLKRKHCYMVVVVNKPLRYARNKHNDGFSGLTCSIKPCHGGHILLLNYFTFPYGSNPESLFASWSTTCCPFHNIDSCDSPSPPACRMPTPRPSSPSSSALRFHSIC